MLTYPRQTALMVVGARAEFLTRFATAWLKMGFSGPLLVPSDCTSLPTGLPGVETGRFEDLLPRADVFVFEFGLASQTGDEPVRIGRQPTADDLERLEAIAALLRQAAGREAATRPAHQGRARRFIGVNVIQNCYWNLFTDHVGAKLNPYCGQVLAGDALPAQPETSRLARLRGRYLPAKGTSSR